MRLLMDWLFNRRRIAELEARVDELQRAQAVIVATDQTLRVLVAALRDCNRELDERLHAMERA